MGIVIICVGEVDVDYYWLRLSLRENFALLRVCKSLRAIRAKSMNTTFNLIIVHTSAVVGIITFCLQIVLLNIVRHEDLDQ